MLVAVIYKANYEEKQRICMLLSSDTQTSIEWQNLGTQNKAAQCCRCRAQSEVIGFPELKKKKKKVRFWVEHHADIPKDCKH